MDQVNIHIFKVIYKKRENLANKIKLNKITYIDSRWYIIKIKSERIYKKNKQLEN